MKNVFITVGLMSDQLAKEHRKERDAIPSFHRRMVKFIEQCGGEVRFDVFANEHLVGSGGFYSSTIDLSKEHGPVATPTEMYSEYRAAYARKVLKAVATVSKRTEKAEICICEIGPGGGELHREIMAQFDEQKNRFENLKTIRYIAVDPNSKHLKNINAQGGMGVRGVVQALPFADESIDVLVAEEVLDSLPYRMIQIDSGEKPGKEAFVRLNGNQLELIFRPLQATGDELAILGQLARVTAAENPRAPLIRFSNDYLSFWQECHRVVSPEGIALVSDYTTSSLLSQMGDGDLHHEEAALKSPYQRDLTHMVNFTLQTGIASFPGFKVNRENLNSGEMRVLLQEMVGGREVIVADKSRSAFAPIDLQRFYDRTPGVHKVISLVLQRGPEDGKSVVDFLKENKLEGGALWIIYSDLACDDMVKFMEIINACTPEQMEWIMANQQEL